MAFFFFKSKQEKLKNKVRETPPLKLGLALGGGGARGFAHIGAIRAFEEEGVSFSMVSGASVGSLIGALYCYGVSANEMIEISHNVSLKDIKERRFGAQDPVSVGRLLSGIIGDVTFSELSVPLFITAVDLVSAQELVLSSGSVARAVSASCAVPGVFKPFVAGQRHFVDGGLLNNIPADVLKVRGADKVVSIDINSTRGQGTESLRMLDILAATMRISLANASSKGLLASDIVIKPDTKRFSAKSKDGYEQMIEEGYLAAKDAVADIKKLLAPPSPHPSK